MPCADEQGIIMAFHEYFPKDALHAELLSLNHPWIEQQYSARFWNWDRPTVFDCLTVRMNWPGSRWDNQWKANLRRHRAVWGNVSSAVGGRYKLKRREQDRELNAIICPRA